MPFRLGTCQAVTDVLLAIACTRALAAETGKDGAAPTWPTAGLRLSAFDEELRSTGNPEADDLGEEYLAETVVRLIRHDRRGRKAILDFLMACPNVRTER